MVKSYLRKVKAKGSHNYKFVRAVRGYQKARPRQHHRKGHYRQGRYVSGTWVNKGFEIAGKFALIAGKKGLEFAQKKGAEVAQKEKERREAEKKEKERKEALGISGGKKPLTERIVQKVPGVKFLEERGKKKAYEEAQKRAAETRLEQGKKVYEIQQKKEVEVKP